MGRLQTLPDIAAPEAQGQGKTFSRHLSDFADAVAAGGGSALQLYPRRSTYTSRCMLKASFSTGWAVGCAACRNPRSGWWPSWRTEGLSEAAVAEVVSGQRSRVAQAGPLVTWRAP